MAYSDIYASDKLKFDIIGGFGLANNKGRRNLKIANNSVLKSKFDSKFFHVGLGGEYLVPINDSFILRPYLRGDYSI